MKKRFPLPVLLTTVLLSLSACNNYGDKVTHGYLEVYYKEGITKAQAQRTVDFLYPYWQDPSGKTDTKSVQLDRNGDTVLFRMVADEKKMALVDDATFYSMGNVFSDSIFNGAPVNIHLTNNRFKTIRVYPYRKPEIKEPVETDTLPHQ
jgi:hypothetical protein